jgi:hypothetical protein
MSAYNNSSENVTATTAEIPTNFVISNFELCFTLLEFPEDVNSLVRNANEKFYIKSSSFTNSSSVLSLAGTGYSELVYSTRLASVKSLFLLCPISSANGVNLNFDSFDITSGGSVQFSIGGKYYPPKALSQGNKSGVLMELKKAVGSLYSTSNSMSISNYEFNFTPSVATSIVSPAKFIIGVNTELLPSRGGHSHCLLSGVSTQNSPITVRINTATATASCSSNVSLLCLYDCLIEVEPAAKRAIVIQ